MDEFNKIYLLFKQRLMKNPEDKLGWGIFHDFLEENGVRCQTVEKMRTARFKRETRKWKNRLLVLSPKKEKLYIVDKIVHKISRYTQFDGFKIGWMSFPIKGYALSEALFWEIEKCLQREGFIQENIKYVGSF